MPRTDYKKILEHSLIMYEKGVDPDLIELPEKSIFPYLITFSPATARKSRVTGILGGKEAPPFVRRGKNIRYRLSDILEWLTDTHIINPANS